MGMYSSLLEIWKEYGKKVKIVNDVKFQISQHRIGRNYWEKACAVETSDARESTC